MTDSRPSPTSRSAGPAPAPDRGPLDDRFYDLVEARFRRILRDNPDFATFLGIHTEDHRLGDGERDAVLERDRRRAGPPRRRRGDRPGRPVDRGRVRARPRDPQPPARPVRRRGPPDLGTALDRPRRRRRRAVRCCSPATSRRSPSVSTSIAGRLEDVARVPRSEHGAGRSVRQVRLWQTIEIESAGEMPGLFDEIVAAGDGVLADGRAAPPRAAADGGQGGRGRLRGLAREHAGRAAPTTGRSGASATTSSSPCGRSTASTPTTSWRSARSSSPSTSEARVAAAREIDPNVDRADGRRPDQERPSGRRSRRRSTPTAT